MFINRFYQASKAKIVGSCFYVEETSIVPITDWNRSWAWFTQDRLTVHFWACASRPTAHRPLFFISHYRHKIDNIGQFWSEKPGLEPHYTPVQAPVCPLLSNVRSKLIILSSKFEISTKSWVKWSLYWPFWANFFKIFNFDLKNLV